MPSRIIDQELYKKFREAVKACLRSIEETLEIKSLIFENDDYLSISNLLSNNYGNFRRLPEVNQCSAYILNNEHYLKTTLSDDNGVPITDLKPDHMYNDIHQMLAKYLREGKTTFFDESYFKSIYLPREYYYLKQKIKFIAYCPLSHFSMESDEIRLNSRMKIRKITDFEISSYMEQLEHFPTRFDLFESRTIEYVIEYTYTRKITDNRQKTKMKIQNQIFRLITVLRLFKNGVFKFDHIKQYPSTYTPVYTPLVAYAPNQGSGQNYVLTKEDKPHLMIYFKKFVKSKKSNKITLSLNRLDYSFERTRNEDKIIDIAIALESLYIDDKDGRPSDRGIFIGTSAGWFLGSNSTREDVKQSIINGYRIRNDIVHGKNYDKKILHETTLNLQNILRETLNKLIFKT